MLLLVSSRLTLQQAVWLVPCKHQRWHKLCTRPGCCDKGLGGALGFAQVSSKFHLQLRPTLVCYTTTAAYSNADATDRTSKAAVDLPSCKRPSISHWQGPAWPSAPVSIPGRRGVTYAMHLKKKRFALMTSACAYRPNIRLNIFWQRKSRGNI